MKNWDKKISEDIQKTFQSSFAFWSLLSRYGLWGFVFFFIGLWASFDFSGAILGRVLLATSVPMAIAFVIRAVVHRLRPTSFQTSYKAMLSYSFPSLHAVSAFASAISLSFLLLFTYDQVISWFGVIILIILAKLIALSRIIVGVHYYSDVLVGGMIGFVIGLIMMLL